MNYNDLSKQYTRDMEFRKHIMIRCAQTAIKELADMISNLQEQEFDYEMSEIAEMFREIEDVARYGEESMLQGALVQSFEYMFKERKGHE